MDCLLVRDTPLVTVSCKTRAIDFAIWIMDPNHYTCNGLVLGPRHTFGKRYMQIRTLFLNNPA